MFAAAGSDQYWKLKQKDMLISSVTRGRLTSDVLAFAIIAAVIDEDARSIKYSGPVKAGTSRSYAKSTGIRRDRTAASITLTCH